MYSRYGCRSISGSRRKPSSERPSRSSGAVAMASVLRRGSRGAAQRITRQGLPRARRGRPRGPSDAPRPLERARTRRGTAPGRCRAAARSALFIRVTWGRSGCRSWGVSQGAKAPASRRWTTERPGASTFRAIPEPSGITEANRSAIGADLAVAASSAAETASSSAAGRAWKSERWAGIRFRSGGKNRVRSASRWSKVAGSNPRVTIVEVLFDCEFMAGRGPINWKEDYEFQCIVPSPTGTGEGQNSSEPAAFAT